MEHWHYDTVAASGSLHGVWPQHSWCVRGLFVCALRSLAAVLLRCWLRVYHRLAIVGRGNLPSDRSFIMIANHASHLDTLCMLSALPIRRLHSAFPVAAKDYFCKSGLRALLATVVVNALPFERHRVPWHGLSLCAHLLQRPGNILILFPEGTRLDSFEPGDFKPGVALLAAGRDVPVVPCRLIGTHAALPKGAWCPRPKAVRLIIGAPRVFAHLPTGKAAAKQICQELHEAVTMLGHGVEAHVKSFGRFGEDEALATADPFPAGPISRVRL